MNTPSFAAWLETYILSSLAIVFSRVTILLYRGSKRSDRVIVWLLARAQKAIDSDPTFKHLDKRLTIQGHFEGL